MKHSEAQQRRLQELAKRYLELVKPLSQAIIITGSYGYAQDHSIRPDSDLDLITLTGIDSIGPILDTPVFAGYDVDLDSAMEQMKKGDANLLTTRHSHLDCLFTVHFMTPEIFFAYFSSEDAHTLWSFRKVPKEFIYDFRNFDGSSIDVPVENVPVDNGHLVSMETCRYKGGRYYSGSPHQKLIGQPSIAHDLTGQVQNSINSLSASLVKQMVQESGGRLDNVSLYKILTKGDRMSPEERIKLLKKEEELVRITAK